MRQGYIKVTRDDAVSDIRMLYIIKYVVLIWAINNTYEQTISLKVAM